MKVWRCSLTECLWFANNKLTLHVQGNIRKSKIYSHSQNKGGIQFYNNRKQEYRKNIIYSHQKRRG